MSLPSIVMKLSPGLDANAKGHCVDGFQGGNMSPDMMFLCCFETFWGISWKVSLRCKRQIACLCASPCWNCGLQEHACITSKKQLKEFSLHDVPCSPRTFHLCVLFFPKFFFSYMYLYSQSYTPFHYFPLRSGFFLTATVCHILVASSRIFRLDFNSTSANIAVSVL